tara:strand:- start:21 stop:278 length:258 start_codon:yes stop_codon:yes gene_type:complete
MIEIDEVSLCKDKTLLITLSDSKGGHMRVGTLVEHKNYFGVGIVIDIRELRGEREYKVHWLREGRNFGWANVDRDLQLSVEIICK